MNAIKMQNINKSFGVNKVLYDVDFEINYGEIHGLIGDNGAGKTTLMNILFGTMNFDEGQIFFEEKPINYVDTKTAKKMGIGMIHQQFKQIDNFTVWQDIVLSMNIKGKLNKKSILHKLKELLKQYDFDINLESQISHLNFYERFYVELIKLHLNDCKIIIFDEPTVYLDENEKNEFYKLITKLKENNRAIVIISHNKYDFMYFDKITKLSQGRVVEYIEEKIEKNYIINNANSNEVYVKLKVDNFEIEINKIEKVALVGKIDSNLMKIFREITGNSKRHFIFNNKDISNYDIRDLRKINIHFADDDSLSNKLIQEFSVRNNLSLMNIENIDNALKGFNLIPYDLNKKICEFSGGNQQKIFLARELYNVDFFIGIEIFKGLDSQTITDLTKKINCSEFTGLFFSYSQDDVKNFADRIIYI